MNQRNLGRAGRAAGCVAAASLWLLSGCGGGSSDAPAPAPAPAPPPAPASLTIGGTAATGAALAGAAVSLKCAGGNATATTASDGSYSANIVGGALPCVARVTPSGGGAAMYGAAASGTRINLTPLTHLIVAQLAQADPAAYYDGFGSGTAPTVAAVAAAQAAVVDLLKESGVDFGAVADATGGPLQAAAGGTAGDAHDKLLDQFGAALQAGGTTLPAFTAAYVTQATGSARGLVALPAELLLRPAASSCGALRSGRYSFIVPQRHASLADQAAEAIVDAAALTLTDAADPSTVFHLSPAASPCAFNTADGGQIYVAQSGVIVFRVTDDDGGFGLAVGLPKQKHALAELAGDWNGIGLARNAAGGYTATAGSVTVDAGGLVTPKLSCSNDATWSIQGSDCGVPPASANEGGMLRVNPAGGFDGLDPGSGAVSTRLYAFRAGNGDLVSMHVDADGSFGFHTRPHTTPLPAVGTRVTSWNVYVAQNLVAQRPPDAVSYLVDSVDAAAGSYLRYSNPVGQTVTQPETVFHNKPRDGYLHRPAATAQNSAGTTVSIAEWTAMGLSGIGISALIVPAPRLLLLNVRQP